MASIIASDNNGTSPFKLPPITYDLTPVNSYASLMHIRSLTDNITTISPEFMLALCKMLMDRASDGVPTVFGYMKAPAKELVLKQVIGSDGYYFKMTTTTCGVDFIWYDRAQGMFLFWGANNFRIVKAMNAIRWRANKYCYLDTLKAGTNAVGTNAVGTNAVVVTSDEEDYSDMPELVSC
jgi:hypothetical protein